MDWQQQKISTIWLSIAASILILFFSFSVWFYRDIYNKENFQRNALIALQTEDSRNAISSLIIDQSFRNRPIIRNLLSEQAQPALAGILNAPRVQTIISRFTSEVYDSLFSAHPRAITLNISSIKSFVETLIFLVESISDAEFEATSIPDTIILVREGDIPSILPFGMVSLALAPIALIAGLILIIWTIIKTTSKPHAIMALGGCLSVACLLVLLFMLWYQPIILGRFTNSDVRTIAEQISTHFTHKLYRQNAVLFLIGILSLTTGFVWQRFFTPRQQAKKTN